MTDFFQSDKNTFGFKKTSESEDSVHVSIDDVFEFSVNKQNLLITTKEEFLQEWSETLNLKKHENLFEMLVSATQSYGKVMEVEDSPIYKGQDVFELENDNHDLKFVDRIRFKEEDFNTDIFSNIFVFCEPEYLAKFSRVSKLWYKLTQEDSLWKKFSLNSQKDPNLSWKQFYIEENTRKMDLWASDEYVFTKIPKGINVTKKCTTATLTNAHIVCKQPISSKLNYWEVKIKKIQSSDKSGFIFGVNPPTNTQNYTFSSTVSINGTGGYYLCTNQIDRVPFNDNDVFGVYLDHLSYKLKFYKNEKLYCEAQLDPLNVYYPIFFLGYNDESVEITCPKIPKFITESYK